jgi:hypothetical protein
MRQQRPQYLGIEGSDGARWRILVWDDPQGELDRIQARLDASETVRSVTVTTHAAVTQEVALDSPAVSCRLFPLAPTVIKACVSAAPRGCTVPAG